MFELIIRDVVAEDIAAITAIYREAVLHGTASFELDPPDEAEMLMRMEAIKDAGFPYIVGVDDNNTLLGYAYASTFRGRPAYRWCCENSVYIDDKAQGQGVGGQLMAELIARCTKLGFRQMISVIGGAAHIASMRLHEKLGFYHIGKMPATGFKHGKWLDSVFMQLSLGEGADTDPDLDAYPGTLYRQKTKP
ncbi:GNAT family N-acetyltransferase [Ahrensia kielensis]|uniref:GNAT family N-acetyltransferase n=1 Tax=Ahrensia kielensis TaxID=76980 RepID=UPI000374E7A1|nr:GNAT family N-acetyltransferase [Ahrensia kielensis]